MNGAQTMIGDHLPACGILVMGATGRLGRLLQAEWAGMDWRVIWQGRAGARGDGWINWAPLEGPLSADLPELVGGTVLCLSGVITGDSTALAANTALAEAACETAERLGARRVLLASSAAVYGRGHADGSPLDEAAPPTPVSPYGEAKADMERALLGRQGVTALRIGNILGADALVGAALRRGGTVTLDPVAGQTGGPERSYIGPGALARVLAALCTYQGNLPPVLNIAAPGAVSMAELLDAVGLPWRFGAANPAALPRVELATARLEALFPRLAGSGDVAEMVADWRCAGKVWR